MMFRKNSLLFYQVEIFSIVMVLLSLAFFPILGLELSLFCTFPFVAVILIHPKTDNELIEIDEIGISCHKAGTQLWKYEWDSIAELKKSSRFLMPSIEVIGYSKCGEPERFALPNHYFQLGRAAKKAIKRYYKPTEHSLNQ